MNEEYELTMNSFNCRCHAKFYLMNLLHILLAFTAVANAQGA